MAVQLKYYVHLNRFLFIRMPLLHELGFMVVVRFVFVGCFKIHFNIS